jgi:hypothetical protein
MLRPGPAPRCSRLMRSTRTSALPAHAPRNARFTLLATAHLALVLLTAPAVAQEGITRGKINTVALGYNP